MESGDFGFRIADFGLEQLQSDQIHNKIPQSTITNPQANTSVLCLLSSDICPLTSTFPPSHLLTFYPLFSDLCLLSSVLCLLF